MYFLNTNFIQRLYRKGQTVSIDSPTEEQLFEEQKSVQLSNSLTSPFTLWVIV